jgi:sugar-phosphatase
MHRLNLKCRAVLFDLDGVLIDSTASVERHWRDWAARHGLDAASLLKIAHGVRNIETMRAVAPDLDAQQESAMFAANEVADTEGVMPVDGVDQTLASIDGACWAIVTSCGTALAQARLMAAKLPLPPLLITGDDVARGKPEADPYIEAARRLGIDAADCIVVEDAPAGVQAGKRAGMRVIGIASTHDAGQLRASGADPVVGLLSDIHFAQAGAPSTIGIEIGRIQV